MAGRTNGSLALQDDEPNISMTPGGASGDDLPQPQSLGYRQIMQSVNNSMRSNFINQALNRQGETPEQRRAKIAMSLRNAENDAGATASTSTLDANEGENNVSSDASDTAQTFRSRVGQKGGEQSGSGSNRVQAGFLKKIGPTLIISVVTALTGGGMYMTQSSVAFTMLDRINDMRDTIGISTNLRSRGLTRAIAKNTNNVLNASSVTKKNVFGKEKFAPTNKMKKKLASNGISFGKKGTADAGKMIYTNADGITKKMTVSEFKAEYNTNPEFKKAYTNSTKTWRTSTEEYNDGIFDKLLKRFNISKNRHADYDAKNDPDGSEGMKRMAKDVDASTNGEDITTKKSRMTAEEVEDVDANGNKVKKTDGKIEAEGSSTESGVKGQKAKGVADKLGAVKDVVGSLTTLGCGITKAYTALKLILAAAQLAQVIATAQEIFEGIDKARAGDAASSPINAIGRSLVERGSENREVVDDVSVIKNKDNPEDSYTEVTYAEKTTGSRSAIQSEGLSSLFTGDPINANDESVASFVPNIAAQKAMDAVGEDAKGFMGFEGSNKVVDKVTELFGSAVDLASTEILSYRTCLVTDSILAAIDLGIDVAALIEAIAGLFTFGVTTAAAAVQEAAWKAFKVAVSAAIGIAVSALIGYLAPVIANIFTRKLSTEFLGEDLGNAIMSGGSAYLSRNHQAGGGLIADESGYMASLTYQDMVNREKAEIDRLARSPFDYTSANTFAGQLAVSMTPIVLQSDSFGEVVGNFGKVLGNSVKGLLPTASAISVQDKVSIAKKQTETNCPELAAMGVLADAYCNPYVTTDFTTIELDSTVDSANIDDYDLESDENSPYNIVKKVASYDSDNFEEGTDIDGVENPKIKMSNSSNLAKFITYCGQRTSPLGTPDQNIASAIDLDQLGSVADSVVGAIPIIGDTFSMLSNQSVLDNYGYVSGANCVMHGDFVARDERSSEMGFDPSYDEVKTYSRYIEDQRLAESMGLIEKSAVSVFLDEYYEKYPLDNSIEGILARFSGLTKQNVIAIEDTVEFYNFYLAYDPTDYYPTPAVHEEDPVYTIEDKDFINDDGMLAYVKGCEAEPTRRLNVAAA